MSTLQHDWNPGELWDGHRATPLLEAPGLAEATGVARVFLKNEAERPLGNFKVLGGMIAALRALQRRAESLLLSGATAPDAPRLVCASDGNHGLAVAAAARHAGVRATVYLPRAVSPIRVARIQATGADVALVAGTYDDAVQAARTAAMRAHCLLIPDTTPDPNDRVVKDVMAGYGVLSDELLQQFAAIGHIRPTHAFIQAGVGGLAAAIAAGFGPHMHDPRGIVVVEPGNAACVAQALRLGRPVRIDGGLESAAEMLSCGLASAPALDILLRYGAQSLLVTESELEDGPAALHAVGGPASTPSGAAGVAGLLAASADASTRAHYGLNAESVVLLVVSEGLPSAAAALATRQL